MTKFCPKLAFLVDMGQAMQVFSMPCWWVGWWLWRAGCISQDTYLLYNILTTAYDGGDNLPLPDQMGLAQKCKSSNRPGLCFSLRNRSKLLRPAQHISSAREFLL